MPQHKGKRKGMTKQMKFQLRLRSEDSSVMPNQDTLSSTQEATKERTEQSENQEATKERTEQSENQEAPKERTEQSENQEATKERTEQSENQEATKERTEQSENQEAPAEPCEIQGASLDPQAQVLKYENNLLPGSKRQNIDPTEIYYTQNSISSRFSNKMLIQDTLEDLRDGTCRVEDIPTIRVYKHRGQWCSMDNRRLWVFKQLKPPGETIPVIVVPVKGVKPIPERISLKVRKREDSGNQRRSVEKRHGGEIIDEGSPTKERKYPDQSN